ncbi:unnamed protein product, partial [Prorocentrum cordatum]
VTERARAALSLPDKPRGVEYLTHGLIPPQGDSNPYKGRSWTFVVDVVATTNAAQESALTHAMKLAQAILEQAYFHVDISAPASPTATAWTAAASALVNRLKISRSGPRADGGEWAMQDLIRFRLRIDPAMPVDVRKNIDTLAAAQSAYMTVANFDWQTPSSSSPTPPSSSATPAARKRPAAAVPGSAVCKRPARST